MVTRVFWIAVSLLESDYDHEFLMAIHLLNKVCNESGSAFPCHDWPVVPSPMCHFEGRCCKSLKNNHLENGTRYFEEIRRTGIKLILQIGILR